MWMVSSVLAIIQLVIKKIKNRDKEVFQFEYFPIFEGSPTTDFAVSCRHTALTGLIIERSILTHSHVAFSLKNHTLVQDLISLHVRAHPVGYSQASDRGKQYTAYACVPSLNKAMFN